MGYLVFGDIHSRLDLALSLIEKAKKENLKLLSVGDIFHGPNGLGLDCFDALVDAGCEFIASNHDFIHVLYQKGIKQGLSPEDAVRAADFHCKLLPSGHDKLERIGKEVRNEIELIGEERLNLISSFPFSRHFGNISIYHAKPGDNLLDAIDDADDWWQEVIKGSLVLHGTVVVGHEGDFAKEYNKMVFKQLQGKVIALDLKAKRGGNVGFIVIENNEIIEIGKF
jgi:hypothetical protein